ncbi:hypothetical protein D3C87_362880 [compost metagenome]
MKKGRLERQILLTFGNVYQDTIDLHLSLKELPKNASLEFITYLLHLLNVRKRSDKMFQSNHLIQWMMMMEGDSQKRLLEFVIENGSIVFDPGFKLLDRRPCLDLIQHLLVHADPEKKGELQKHGYNNLFRLLLYFNARAIEYEKNIFKWDGTGTFQQFADEILKLQTRNLENERPKNYVIQFLKVYYFFKFCESDTEYSFYLKQFLEELSINSYKSYLWMLLSPYLKLQVNDEPTPKIHIDGDDQFLFFYKRLAINGNIEVDVDYKSLRAYPLYELGDNMFLFLDFRFFVDKFYNGFLFDFSARTGLPFPKLKKTMGIDFSEPILFYSIMSNCFEGYGEINLTGTGLKKMLKDSEPDYYIRRDRDIFLFEFKDILISSEIKYADSLDEIKAGLLNKLERDVKGKRKGISQLLNSIKEISCGKYVEKGVDNLSPNGVTIFPILVHTDVSLEAYGTNYFLAQRMKELISMEDISNLEIKNLTLIHLDTLLLLQDHFKSHRLELGDCLRAYILYVCSGDPVNDTIPFDEFVKYYFVENNNTLIGKPSIFKEIIMDFEKRQIEGN